MIIGFDGSRAFINGRTGTENYSYQILKNLAKIDIKNSYLVYVRSNPSVIARPQSGKAIYRKDRHADARDDNFSWPKNFKFITISGPRLWTQMGLAINTFKDDLDLLFIPAHTLPLIRKPGLKTVITVHDLGAEYLPKMHQLKQRFYLKLMTHYQIKSATKIIAVSEATKKDLVKKIGINPQKIKVIYEGVDREVFKPIKGEALVNSLREFDLVQGRYFLFVGTIQPRKNLERLIKAFAVFLAPGPAGSQPHPTSSLSLRGLDGAPRSPSPLANIVKLALVGSRGWLSEEIYILPKKLGIEDKVKFLGRVDEKDLPALYSGAIALVFPSLFEGFGLPILEAFSCKCPVITSNVSSMPEVAGEAAIFIDPLNTDDLAAKMRDVRDYKVRDKLVNKGLKQVEKFSWEKAARETLEVFEEVGNSG